MTRRIRGHARAEAGETLLELIITIAIMGLSVVAVLGGVLIAIQTTNLHRQHTQTQAKLRNWAESISGDTTYTTCPGPADFPVAPSMPTGFTATITAVQHWNGTDFGGTCATDTGVQKVTLQVSVVNPSYPGFTSSLDVIVRKPCVTGC